MRIEINSQPTETSAGSIQELAIELNLPKKGVAVALGNKMVPRAAWPETALKENDCITIVKAACGG